MAAHRLIRAARRAVVWVLVTAAGASAQAPPVAPAELLVRWRAGAARPTAALDTLGRRLGLRSVQALLPPAGQARPAGPTAAVRRWTRLRFDGRLGVDELARRYAAVPGVEAAVPNIMRRTAAFRSDDPLLDEQWNLELIGWTDADPGSAAGVLVAIVDSGIDLDHPDLAPALWHNEAEVAGLPGVDDDGNGYVDDVVGWDFADAPGLPGDGDYLDPDPDPDDESGHGTHVAGIVGAVVGNGIGVAGVAPDVGLMALRAGFNVGGAGYLQDDDIAAAIVYAVDNGADVINLSLGDPRPSPLLADAVDYAVSAGVVVVAAAGNEASDAVFYPARLDETIAVAAAGRGGAPASFSNYGPSIDLLAPGVAVHSTRPGGTYGDLSGTSMAAPHVAGAAALVRAVHPEYSPLQVFGALTAAAVDLDGGGWGPVSGHGLLRLPAAGAPAPLAIAVRQPPTDRRVAGPLVDIEATVAAPGPAAWSVDWAPGNYGAAWRSLEAGQVPGDAEVSVTWTAGALPAGDYTLRAHLSDARGATHEDRVVVHLDPAPAPVVDLRFVRALAGDRWRQLVLWDTGPAAGGTLELWQADRRRWRTLVPAGRTAHSVTLPEDLPPGAYQVRVYTDGVDAAAVDSLELVPSGVQRWNLEAGPAVDDGYLLPRLTDFDGDGRPELAAMVYGGGAYGVTRFWEWPDLTPRFTSSQLYIPWETGDFDGDGAVELMAVDARRVRLFEAPAAGGFPQRLAWQTDDAWGGEVADLDGDGRPELLLRSARAQLFRVFESRGDDDFAETAALVDDTPGENELGDRQAIVDGDGDGVHELVGGDSDGDLIAYRAAGDDVYRSVWRELGAEDGEIDGRLVGPAADLDGDGAEEFVAGRLTRDPYDLEGRRWTLSVYGDAGAGYHVEWQADVMASTTAGSGVAVGDLDGDGDVEWVAVLPPYLYVFQAADGGFRVVWQADAQRTQRPLVGDLDADGRTELVYNRAAAGPAADKDGAGLVVAGWPGPAAATLLVPPGWQAWPRAAGARLSWEGVTGAAAYALLRDGIEVARVSAAAGGPVYGYEEDGLASDRAYGYRVAGLDSAGRRGPLSVELRVRPQVGPTLRTVTRVTARQLALDFDQAMGPVAAETPRYALTPDVALPEAAVLDRGGTRVLLAFDRDLPDSGAVRLVTSGLRSRAGAALQVASVEVALSPLEPATRLLTAAAPTPVEIALRFDRPVHLGGATTVRVDDGRIAVDTIAVGPDGELRVELAAATPLRPLGRRYTVVVEGAIDDLGRTVQARATVTAVVTVLDEILAFPNPFDPERTDLTVAGLPSGSRVEVFGLDGRRLWSGAEADDDGGVRWDGRNQAGGDVAPGVYLVRAAHGGRHRLLKVALVRGR